jgi:YidC/Oxa1 family membrane protein insertase
MDQQKRLYLAIALSFGLTLVFMQFVWKPQAEAEAARIAALDAGAAPVVVAPPAAADGGLAQAAPEPEAPVKSVEAARQAMKLTFTSEGGVLTSAVMLGKREHEQQPLTIPEGYARLFGKKFGEPPQMNMAVPPKVGAGQFAVAVQGPAGLSPRLKYTVAEEAPGKVVFTGHEGPWRVKKAFTWDEKGYDFGLDVTLENTSAQPATGDFVVSLARGVDPEKEEKPSLFGGIGNQASVVCHNEKELVRKTPSDTEPSKEVLGALSYAAIDQQYFLAAVWPKDAAQPGKCVAWASNTERRGELSTPLTVAPGQSVTRSYRGYLGPKELELLQAAGKGAGATFAPGLESTVDLGMWAFICKALLFFLRFFHSLVGNWGVAIVMLTLTVKLAVLPLTHRAMVSAEKMKAMQPQMEAVKKKYPDDTQKQMQEMQKLGLDPFASLSGCLPMLLQMPIWIALFTTLRTSYELYGEPFFGVWADLTIKDPTYLFPVLLGITMIITQRLQPQMMDQSQAFMFTWVMPIFFTAIMMNYPAGLALYIFTNNLLSIVQQYLLRKYLAKTGQAAPKPKVA